MLKKNAFFSPRFLLPMAAASVLAGAFLFYYFLFVSRQEASLDDRAFRSLALLNNQIGEMTGNYGNLLEFSVRQIARGSKRKPAGATSAASATEQFLSRQVPGCPMVPNQGLGS